MKERDGTLAEGQQDAAELCLHAAQAFRRGEEAAGSANLVDLVDAVGELASRGDLRVEKLGPVLEELLAAQGRGDFLRVADVLEFVLADALRS